MKDEIGFPVSVKTSQLPEQPNILERILRLIREDQWNKAAPFGLQLGGEGIVRSKDQHLMTLLHQMTENGKPVIVYRPRIVGNKSNGFFQDTGYL